MRKISPLIVTLIAANFALISWFGFQKWQVIRRVKAKEYAENKETAKRLSASRRIKEDDYMKLVALEREWHKTGAVSDADLQWCLDLLDSNPNPDVPKGKVAMQQMVSGRFGMHIRQVTPRQKDVLFNYSKRVLRGDGGFLGNDYRVAFTFADVTNDKRLIPYLLPLLENKRKRIREETQELVTQLQKTP